MIRNGATTLWETWAASDNVYSKNHPMFGSVDEWFYRSLLGINPGAPAFEKVIIHPQPAGRLRFAKGSYNSVRGLVGSSWRIEGRRLKLTVEIPANTSAEIWVPVRGEGNVTESGNPVATVKDIKLLRQEKGYFVYETGSGRYTFESDFKR
jgi:alpha-L-rhamnosidase